MNGVIRLDKSKIEMIKDTEETEFEKTGLDANVLERMSVKERDKVLREAGLDPEEYAF